MSNFLDSALAKIETISTANADAAEAKAAVAELKQEVANNTAGDTNQSTAISELQQVINVLLDKLAQAPAIPTPAPAPDTTSGGADTVAGENTSNG